MQSRNKNEFQIKRRKTLNELFNANESNQHYLHDEGQCSHKSHTHYVFDARSTLQKSGASSSAVAQAAAILKSRR